LKNDIRTGIGFDIHPFAENRELIIGGVKIPFERGLLGHSDADVLLHAICDAMLGALSLGDIGQHFPDTDKKFKDADSIFFLDQVYQMMLRQGYSIGNIDSVIIAQKPKLAPFIPEMKRIISTALQIEPDQISVKATTSEKLGSIGREEGISAFASVLIVKNN